MAQLLLSQPRRQDGDPFVGLHFTPAAGSSSTAHPLYPLVAVVLSTLSTGGRPLYIAVVPPPGHENVETMANPQPSSQYNDSQKIHSNGFVFYLLNKDGKS